MMGHPKTFLTLLLAGCVLGAGCLPIREPQPSLPHPSVSDPQGGSWTEVSVGFDRLEYRYSTSTSAKLIVYRLDAQRFEVQVQAGESKTVAAWSDEIGEAVLISNAAYFHEDESPSGFLSVDGTRIGDRQFDLDKSGLVITSPRFEIVDTLADPRDLSKIEEGLQSYPFLVKNGEPAVAVDSGLRARRTFIGTDRSGRIYIGMAEGDLSLYGLAELLPGLGITWDMVLNLDGGPSSGLASPLVSFSRVQENSLSSVPSVLVVLPRK